MTIEDKAAEEFAKEIVGENYMDREDWQDSAFKYMFAFKAGIEWKEEQIKQYLLYGKKLAQEKGNQDLVELFEIIIEDLKL